MSLVRSSQEIEQRYIVDPLRWLYLPREYQEFHQAEIGSWQADTVISTFNAQVNQILVNDSSGVRNQIEVLLATIDTTKQIKLRIRRIFDPKINLLHAEFTLKIKEKHSQFKIYQETNLPIDPILANTIIEHIAPRHTIDSNTFECWVRKFRYHVLGPDGKQWDVDILKWLNAWLHIGEIEVDSTKTVIVRPPWAVMQVNWKHVFRYLGTKELQKIPWSKLSDKKKEKYLQVLGKSASDRELLVA